ncbi:MAG: Arylsulfatase precursor [candidate division BRC1 bacterium ADurb.BinA364]|nr:MAG: Arylsulfatase precursor [candidate division BRC1 bacterium ADurb.BinA364]
MRFTDFYSTSGVCTPSRSSLMTGCYPRRVNMHVDSNEKHVFFPIEAKGLHPDETTLAELLKARGYATMCIGKWHLGDQPEALPTRHGFDAYYGLPYSNDMGGTGGSDRRPPLPLLRGETVVEAPANQATLTRRYTLEAVRFIEANKDKPFFLYLPHTMVHEPLHSSALFSGASANGDLGDALEEMDWSTGEILRALAAQGIDGRTLVLFTSDNGAPNKPGRSNAPLSGFKGSTMEGGMRVPCVARWPGKIPAGAECDEIASTLDILPTFAALAGADISSPERPIDGLDIRPLLLGEPGARSPREAFFYYQVKALSAVRSGQWKLRLGGEKTPAKLYDLSVDVGETQDVAASHPDIVRRLEEYAARARADLGDGDTPGKGQRPAARIDRDPAPLVMPSQSNAK